MPFQLLDAYEFHMWIKADSSNALCNLTEKVRHFIIHQILRNYISKYVVRYKTFTENWVGKQSFFVFILTTA